MSVISLFLFVFCIYVSCQAVCVCVCVWQSSERMTEWEHCKRMSAVSQRPPSRAPCWAQICHDKGQPTAILIYCWVVDSSCVKSKDPLDSDSLDFHTSDCFLFSFLYVGPTGALVRAFAAFLFYSHIHANWLTRFTINNLQTSWTKELSNKQTSRQIEKMLKLHNHQCSNIFDINTTQKIRLKTSYQPIEELYKIKLFFPCRSTACAWTEAGKERKGEFKNPHLWQKKQQRLFWPRRQQQNWQNATEPVQEFCANHCSFAKVCKSFLHVNIAIRFFSF